MRRVLNERIELRFPNRRTILTVPTFEVSLTYRPYSLTVDVESLFYSWFIFRLQKKNSKSSLADMVPLGTPK